MKKFLFLIPLLFLTGCVSRPSLPYPELYTQANLPQYEKAWVTNTGRQQTSLTEGIRLRLRSKKQIPDIRAYYETELAALGWTTADEPPEGWETFYLRLYDKDDMTLQLTIEDQGREGQSIAIIYQQKTTE